MKRSKGLAIGATAAAVGVAGVAGFRAARRGPEREAVPAPPPDHLFDQPAEAAGRSSDSSARFGRAGVR